MGAVIFLAKQLFVGYQVVKDVVVRLPAGSEPVQDQGIAGSDHLLGQADDVGVRCAAMFCLSKRRGGTLPRVEGCRRIRLFAALGWGHVGSLPSLGTRGIEARKGFLPEAHENATTTDSAGQCAVRRFFHRPCCLQATAGVVLRVSKIRVVGRSGRGI